MSKETQIKYLLDKIEELEGKKIESVKYKDGSILYRLDLDHKTIAIAHLYADEHNCTIEEAISQMIESGLNMMKETKNED